MKHNAVKWSTKLITSLKSKCYRSSGILIHWQNMYVTRSQMCTDHHKAKSKETVNKGLNLPVHTDHNLCSTCYAIHSTEIPTNRSRSQNAFPKLKFQWNLTVINLKPCAHYGDFYDSVNCYTDIGTCKWQLRCMWKKCFTHDIGKYFCAITDKFCVNKI
jgi:hypothetical protein